MVCPQLSETSLLLETNKISLVLTLLSGPVLTLLSDHLLLAVTPNIMTDMSTLVPGIIYIDI